MVLMFMQWRDNIRKGLYCKSTQMCAFCNMSFLSIYVCVSFNRCFVCCLGADLNAINQCCIASVYYITSSGQYSTACAALLLLFPVWRNASNICSFFRLLIT